LGGADGAEAAWETTAAVRATGTGGTSSSITGSLSNASGSVTAWGATAAVRAFGTGGTSSSSGTGSLCGAHLVAVNGTTGRTIGRYISRIRSTFRAACASDDRSGITGSLINALGGVTA